METEQLAKKDIFLEKTKKVMGQIEGFVNKAVYTDYFIWTLLAISFITWVTECAPVGIITIGIILSFVLAFSRDILPLFVSVFCASLMIYTKNLGEFLYLWPVTIPLGIAFVIFIVRNSIRKHKDGEKFRLGKMFFPQLAVSVVLFIGGAGVISGEGYVASLPNIFGLGVAGLVVYMLARNFISTDNTADRTTYFAKALAYIGVIIAVQLVVVIIKSGLDPSQWAKAYWHVGWGNRNSISTFLLFTAPMCLYLSTKQRFSVVYLLMAVLQYGALILTFSRGGILFGFIALVFGVVFVIIKAKDRKRMLIYFGVVCGVVLIMYFIFMKDINNAVKSLLSRGTGLSGRDELYAEAWELFKQNPFHGNGLGLVGKAGIFGDVVSMYWFHSTLFQVLACMGILGIVAYGYGYVVKGILIGKNIRNGFNLFVLVVFIGFEGYSMMDVGTFVPGAFPLIVLVLMCLVEMFTSTPEMIEMDKLAMETAKAERKARAKGKLKDDQNDTIEENETVSTDTETMPSNEEDIDGIMEENKSIVEEENIIENNDKNE